ncbi:MAG: phenylacetic acid degradation b [Streptosporangiales bacterium]|nr:phenylacetic acid degradation b [Streptosporangiales bacterium]
MTMIDSVRAAAEQAKSKHEIFAEEIRFEVFGRRDHNTALTHIGSVSAPNEAIAMSRARWVFSRPALIEMCIAPHSGFVTLTEADSKVKVKVV